MTVATNYPEMRLATVDIPQEPLDSFEQGQVEQSLAKLEMDGMRYALIGASGSAKNGKYYAVEAGYERALAERFQHWPQSDGVAVRQPVFAAAMSFEGTLFGKQASGGVREARR
ncbi:MAG TPA: hypothetical protein VMX16_09825 [Terriglobia bacterium]|nr:hypothetical protein [Terriglobia bacterium]